MIPDLDPAAALNLRNQRIRAIVGHAEAVAATVGTLAAAAELSNTRRIQSMRLLESVRSQCSGAALQKCAQTVHPPGLRGERTNVASRLLDQGSKRSSSRVGLGPSGATVTTFVSFATIRQDCPLRIHLAAI